MTRDREIQKISLQDAIDNLSVAANIDLNNPPNLGIVRNHQLITDVEPREFREIYWLTGEGVDVIYEILDMSFHAIHYHLVRLIETNEVDWNDPKIRKGIQSMLDLVASAASQMDRYLTVRLGKPPSTKVKDRVAYQDLQFFYQNRFSHQFKADDQAWEQDWTENPESVALDVAKTGLMDFETVRKDLSYELFSIRNENGGFYFDSDLLRNIKIACFAENPNQDIEEDPLLKIRTVIERDLQASSERMIECCRPEIEAFYKIFRNVSKTELAKWLSQAIIAIDLTSNPKNLIQNTSKKSSYPYFHDFQTFIRNAMRTKEYQHLISHSPSSKDPASMTMLKLVSSLCYAFFHRTSGTKEETIALLHRYMRKGESKKTALKGKTLWTQMIIEDERFRDLLSAFPNGALFKVLDQIQEESELICFDPLIQGNYPQKVFDLNENKIHVLRFPSPTHQEHIHQATIVEEFLGLLRHYAAQKPALIHLMIHFQNRDAWQETARAKVIENLQTQAEFSQELIVVTLPKSNDFYYQMGEFVNIDNADDFISLLKKQLKKPQEIGFFIPSKLIKPKLFSDIVDIIYEVFFEKAKRLSRQERENFIEILYTLLILHFIDQVEPYSLSFTCKDSVDVGAAALAGFYGFIHILKNDMPKHADDLRYLMYAPAFFVRERSIDTERFNRQMSFLDFVDQAMKKNPKILQNIQKLYSPKFIQML